MRLDPEVERWSDAINHDNLLYRRRNRDALSRILRDLPALPEGYDMGITKEQFEEKKREVPGLTYKMVIQVRASTCWVGAFASFDSAVAEDPSFNTSYRRPEGKSVEDCVRRGVYLATQELGRLSEPVLAPGEDW